MDNMRREVLCIFLPFFEFVHHRRNTLVKPIVLDCDWCTKKGFEYTFASGPRALGFLDNGVNRRCDLRGNENTNQDADYRNQNCDGQRSMNDIRNNIEIHRDRAYIDSDENQSATSKNNKAEAATDQHCTKRWTMILQEVD